MCTEPFLLELSPDEARTLAAEGGQGVLRNVRILEYPDATMRIVLTDQSRIDTSAPNQVPQSRELMLAVRPSLQPPNLVLEKVGDQYECRSCVKRIHRSRHTMPSPSDERK
ncbi:hypothetical protein GMRT_13872 [Giardia muris]|uniref:Uncharacterized protein n=1 Tax=Giardia muris TaxID=5742 RepID=A0A4Z1T0D9_GIAMU|nr:hypothetical protein GMRT_13872 [Giardia muris]|eukprot:TNJ27363.1 hypothetical protein GMRT_13872 [Giardia muris]